MDFNTLTQQIQCLTIEEQDENKYSGVEPTIGDILQRIEDLHTRVTQTGTKDAEAQILLCSKGIDVPKMTQTVESLCARNIFETSDPIIDLDIESFLKNERENIILSGIDEANKNLRDSVKKQKWDSIKREWNQEKISFLNALVGPSEDFLDIERTLEPTVLNEKCSTAKRLSALEMRYAEAVCKYNDAFLKGGHRPNLAQMLARAVSDCASLEVKEMWSILLDMIVVTPISCDVDPIKTRQQNPQFVLQAKRCLESRYKVYMNSIVNLNLHAAARGGVPSMYNLVSAFVSIYFNPDNMIGLVDFINDKPLWPMVYCSIRCGELEVALSFLQNADNQHIEFMEVLLEKINNPEQKINSKLAGHLKLQYTNKIKNSTDPFKKATYCIILGCDAQDSHSAVAKSIDDFLWIKLSVLHASEDPDYSNEQLTYAGLQTLILEEHGENYFNASEKPHIYFEVLALTGQFEAAIEFLARSEANRPHAVHMALALNELGMVGGPRSVQQPLLSIDFEDPKPLRRLNLARLIMLYVKPFEATGTAEALQYYFFLRNFKNPEGRNLFQSCVCDLAIGTSFYELIFGTLDPSGNGFIIGGLFEQFNSAGFDTKTVAGIVAEELLKHGMIENAIRLFDFAGMHNKAIKNLLALLTKVVHQKPKPGTMRERLAIEAATFNERLIAHKIKVEPQIADTFSLLRELLIFYDYYHVGKDKAALEVLSRNKLAPMNMNDVDKCVQNFKRLGGEVCKVFPDVMLTEMEIIYKQYRNTPTCKDDRLKLLREKAKALNNLAATVPYRMPIDINKKLIQIEILMH